jgi:hypothetical protein
MGSKAKIRHVLYGNQTNNSDYNLLPCAGENIRITIRYLLLQGTKT